MADAKYAWEDKDVDQHGANELFLFITNDGDLYRQQYSPILKNLTIKKSRGIYDRAKAVKLFMYLVDNGAKMYESGGRPWSGGRIPAYFPKPLREAVAEELRDRFEDEYELGNYSNLVLKKYQAKPKSKPRRRSSGRTTPTLRGMR